MKEGWWLRLDNGESIRIHEHEIDIRRPDMAAELGVPDELFSQFRNYEPETDRIEFLTWILENVPTPLARIRGHGNSVTIEYAADNNEQAFKAIRIWGREVCGPFLLLSIRNLRTGERFSMKWDEFERSGTIC